jgi:hypothetical protein
MSTSSSPEIIASENEGITNSNLARNLYSDFNGPASSTSSGSDDATDTDVVEIGELAGPAMPRHRIRCHYLDNDQIQNIDEVLTRWSVKKLANVNKNFSCSNYKRLRYGDDSPPATKKIRPGVFVLEDENKTRNQEDKLLPMAKAIINEEDTSKLEKDAQAVERRKQEINKEAEKTKLKLKEINSSLSRNLREIFLIGQHDQPYLINQLLTDTLFKLSEAYERRVAEVEEQANEEINGLMFLFESRNYELGKLDEYRRMETYQPSARRLKYYDDGRRVMLLPLNTIKNVMIEDAIYGSFYGHA